MCNPFVHEPLFVCDLAIFEQTTEKYIQRVQQRIHSEQSLDRAFALVKLRYYNMKGEPWELERADQLFALCCQHHTSV
jgi:hypothetical protein